ncbi:MAG: formate dehydrogenase accessory sulfurtransferase FdhD [Flavobacteriales bacterium]|nr:formate dehydrogenase accessory sulfurtransferase FdhD [Flavobacteriales bacterium]MBK9287567.1 formate dehydrogenase accessory sulfurtransferase FdhD [Flavobacteriales bacterium]MBL0037271.1 formate dehydrogenase accessory sulfurtransferase FdhD [Flavobacteriales bacterium]
MRTPVAPIAITRVENGTSVSAEDLLVTEEPLEIRLGYGPEHDRTEIRLSVTMRTPGNDEELTRGFLFTEGLITDPAQLLRVAYCENVKEEERGNVVRAELHPSVDVDPAKWQRNFYTTSSCGVCGKSSIEAVQVNCPTPLPKAPELSPALITSLPDRMRAAQTVFKHTGGIHAAALFNAQGELLLLREDVGRHNAVDKVIGAAQLAKLPLAACVLLVSGRAGFELVQKCVVAGIPAMAAVGAPSSLSVQLARASGLLLIGFLRNERFNIYAQRADTNP